MNQKKRFKNLRNIHLLKFTLTLWILKKNIRTIEWMLQKRHIVSHFCEYFNHSTCPLN